MNAKIVTLLERHIEKIVLAVALAGAGFIVWTGIQPVTLPGDPTATPGTVEEKVSQAVADLEAARKQTQAIPESRLDKSLHDYVTQYGQVMLHHPLPDSVVATNAIPRFAPLQESLGGSGSNQQDNGGGTLGTKLALAVVPAPTDVTVTADRGSVLPPPTDPNQPQPQPQPGQPGVATQQPVDKNWVCVSGTIPWGQYVNYFKNLPADQRLPDENQHNVLCKIDVQRRSLTPTGWSDWASVPATTAGGQPVGDVAWDQLNETDWISTVTQLDALFPRIAEPAFYYLAPKDPTTQAPTPILAPNAKTPDATTRPAGAPGAPGTPPARPGIPGRPGTMPPGPPRGVRMDQEGNIIGGAPAGTVIPDSDNPNPAAPQPVPGLALDVNALKQSGNVPFWFWDETVQAGQTYQYRVRLLMYNPLYRYPDQTRLPNAQVAKEPTVASPWVVVNKPVNISGDLAFFIDAPLGGAGNKVRFVVFKWTNGGWYEADWTRELGQTVTGRVQLVDKTPPTWVDVDTKYTLVDVQNPPGDVVAVLMAPNGELVTHSVAADRANPDRADKEANRVKPIGKAPPPKPVNQPRPGPRNPNPNTNNPDNQ